MEEIIIELLNNNLRLIIPDFGAFIIRQKEPRMVVFNEFLRFNDGLLINHIVKSEGIDADVAAQRVTHFTAEIRRTLHSGKAFEIRGLGTLSTDDGGKITFIQEGKNLKPKPQPDKKPETTIALDNDAGNKIKKVQVKRTASSAEIPATDKIKKEVKEPVTGKNKNTVADDSRKESEQPVTEVTKTEQAETLKTEKHTRVNPNLNTGKVVQKGTLSADSVEREIVKSEGKSKFTRTEIIIFSTLFLIANCLIISYFVFNKDEKKPEIGTLAATSADSLAVGNPEPVELSAVDTMDMLRDFSDKSDQADVISNNGNPRYYIVAGCFRDENNADELVKFLKNQGYQAEKFGKIGNLFAVSFASYISKDEARIELNRIRDEVSADAWMTRF